MQIKENNQKISLLICAYNEEKYIGNCLNFVIKNSDNLFYEIIVVDNASTDKTAAIVANFKKHNIKLVTEKEKGLTKARQRAFLEAQGDILAFIDADTQMSKGWVKQIINEYKKNLNLVCLSGPYVYYDTNKFHKLFVKMYWYLLAIPSYWLIGYMVVGGNFVIKKEILKKMGGFDEKIKFYGEDTNIARRASRFGKVKFHPSFIMPTSARRFSKESTLKTAVVYVLNFISEIVLHRPFTDKYKDIR